MEISLRLLLLLMGFMVIAGIIWDSRKNKTNNKKEKILEARREQFNERNLQPKPIEPLPKIAMPEDMEPENTEIFMIHVMSKNRDFSGEALLDAFNEVRLYYGERQIFYRYENADGTGNTMFSVVSAVEPGYFEISKMEHFVTPGVTLFFKLTEPNQSIAAFESMLRTAKQLALRLDGELIDEDHGLLTVQTIEQSRRRIRRRQSQFRTVRVS